MPKRNTKQSRKVAAGFTAHVVDLRAIGAFVDEHHHMPRPNPKAEDAAEHALAKTLNRYRAMSERGTLISAAEADFDRVLGEDWHDAAAA